MKLQGLGIICAIILLPIAVILSYYIQMQVDTINLRTSYDTKILDATHDAVAALELNTANEKLSNVSDSLRSILEASNNVFFNTLLTNFGMSNASKSLFEPFVPAILYTLYDGYYIYSPTRSPDVLKYGDYVSVTLQGSTKVQCGVLYGSGEAGGMDIPRPIYDTGDSNYYDANNQALIAVNGQAITEIEGQMFYRKDPTKTASTGAHSYTIIAHSLTEGDIEYTTDINAALLKNDFLLKSYMPYAARYVEKESDGTPKTDPKFDVVINYTLDNYLNIEGTIKSEETNKDVYFTKTGYLIDPDSVTVDSSNSDLLDYNEQDVEELIGSGQYNNISIDIKVPKRDGDGNIITSGGVVQYDEVNTVTLELVYNPGESLESLENDLVLELNHYQEAYATQLNGGTVDPTYLSDRLNNIRALKSKIQMIKAVQYYVRNKIFSDWVYNNLNNIKESDTDQTLSRDVITQLQTDEEKAGIDLFRDLSISDVKIFENRNQDVEINSPFINHKLAIMRNSIQYNLNLAFSTYTKKTKGYVYELPIMSDYEWDKIMSRVSMVSYFEGMPCGSKIYSNYAVVSSTNNEITVIPDELYYVPTKNFSDSTTEAHRIDCDKLPQLEFESGETASTDYDKSKSYLIAFRSKELKYDRVFNKTTERAEYDYLNLMCYDCIVNNNTRFDNLTNNHTGADSSIDFQYLQKKLESGSNKEKLLYREYLIAVGSQRQGLYKTNAMTKSEGYKTEYNSVVGLPPMEYSFGVSDYSKEVDLSLPLNKIKALEITINKLQSGSNVEKTIQFEVLHGDISLGTYTLNASKYTRAQTMRIDVDPALLKSESVNKKLNLVIRRALTNTVVTGNLVGVRVIYK